MLSSTYNNSLNLKKKILTALLLVTILAVIGMVNIGSASATDATAQTTFSLDGDCVIPDSGPWPPCATGGGGGGTTGGNTGGNSGGTSGGDCVIPASGPWPPCATGGGGGGTTGGSTGGNSGGTSGGNTGGSTGPSQPLGPIASFTRPAPPAGPGAPATSSTVINITDDVAVNGVRRLGINVGEHDQYGASQLLKNLIPNPGFESSEYAMVFHARPGATGDRVQADNWETTWNSEDPAKLIGHPQGFWNGAQFEVLTGASKGRTGTITRYTHEPDAENGKMRSTFYLSTGGAPLGLEDIILVSTFKPGYALDTQRSARAEVADKRPGSSGQQSLRLIPTGGGWQPSWQANFDSFARDADRTAGKLLRIRGPWHFEVWAKPAYGAATMRIEFRRGGETTFISEEVQLKAGWQKIAFDFNASEMDDPLYKDIVPSPLSLEFFTNSEVLVDDVVLQRSDYNNPTVFSDTYVRLLRELRPGVLRNWGEQRGSSLNNQLADQFGRKMTGSSPEHRIADNYHYSLHEFLQLSQTVGANPWYVVPSTFSKADLQNLIAYLSAPNGSHPYANRRAAMGQTAPWTSVFGQIHLEFGNEIWGANFGADPFLGSSLRGGIAAGQVANDRIDLMKKSPFYNAGKFDMVIGGQARFAGRQQEIEDNSSTHDSIGFAPYFGELSQRWNSDADRYYPAYAHHVDITQGGDMKQSEAILANKGQGTQMAIYEINVAAISGGASADIRNDYMTSQGAGISVPLTMLAYQRDFGIRTQAGFTSAQFSTSFSGGRFGRAFGMLRDIEATGVKRPTWLGMELANKAIKGDMLTVNQSGTPSFNQNAFNGIKSNTTVPFIESFAFRQGGQQALVLFNLDLNRAHAVNINLTHAPRNARVSKLYTEDIHADNEDAWNVDIFQDNINMAKSTSITLPPHSMYVIEWSR